MANFKTTQVLTLASDDFDNNAFQRFMVLGDDGFPRFVYLDNAQTELHFVQCLDADGSTYNDNIVLTSSGSDVLRIPSLTIGSDGFARISVVVKTVTTASSLHILICTNATGTSNTDITLSSTTSVPEHAIALTSSDAVNVVYNDYTANTVKLARCDANGGNVTTSTITNFTSSFGTTLAAHIASDGFLRILCYLNSPTKKVRYLVCSSADGTSFTENTVYVPVASPYFIDMVLGTDDKPIVIVSTSGGIFYVKSTTTDGSAVSTATLTTNVPYYLSLTKDDQNRGLLAYNKTGTRELYYVQITSDDGSTFETTDIGGGRCQTVVFWADDGMVRILSNGSDHMVAQLYREQLLPIYNTSLISAVQRTQQNLPFPRFVIGGAGGASGTDYALFKKSDTGGFNLWRSQVTNVGTDFDVMGITFNLIADLDANTEIIPVLHFDDDTSQVVGTTINSTNYSDKFIQLAAKNFGNSVHGKDNFFLEFQFTGSTLSPISLPINIDVDILDT